MKYLKAFVIGSCAFISLPNYYSIYNNPATFHHIDRELKYYNIPFEREAYDNQDHPYYILNRKRYCWLKNKEVK